MKKTAITPISALFVILFIFFLIISQIVTSNVATRAGNESLVMWSNTLKKITPDEQKILIKRTLDRVQTYELYLQNVHLSSGMVISRSLIDRTEKDLCDSLLFSSIRYVSLKKLGFLEESQKAWSAIERSRKNGFWLRHPKCSRKSLSRDMLSGLLLALLQNPPRSREFLQHLVNQLDQKSGYFSHGPVYVSYLTPGLGKIIRLLGDFYELPTDSFPDIIKRGYSTNELSVILLKPGYEAHLAGLALWIELEIMEILKIKEKPGVLEHFFNAFIRPFSKGDLTSQSFSWTAKRLFEIDPKNLFFVYLRLRAAGAMNSETASRLLQMLLDMKEFPLTRLPTDCDRRSDYLWQRSSKNYQNRSVKCSYQYPGVDFTWMASLLLTSMDRQLFNSK